MNQTSLASQLIILIIAPLFLWMSCATETKPSLTDEGDLTPNWETHKDDEKIINSTAPLDSIKENFKKNPDMELELRQYITINYHAIGKDLSQKKGKYLPGLLKIMKVPKAKAQTSIKHVSKIYAGSESSQVFADKIVEWLRTSN